MPADGSGPGAAATTAPTGTGPAPAPAAGWRLPQELQPRCSLLSQRLGLAVEVPAAGVVVAAPANLACHAESTQACKGAAHGSSARAHRRPLWRQLLRAWRRASLAPRRALGGLGGCAAHSTQLCCSKHVEGAKGWLASGCRATVWPECRRAFTRRMTQTGVIGCSVLAQWAVALVNSGTRIARPDERSARALPASLLIRCINAGVMWRLDKLRHRFAF